MSENKERMKRIESPLIVKRVICRYPTGPRLTIIEDHDTLILDGKEYTLLYSGKSATGKTLYTRDNPFVDKIIQARKIDNSWTDIRCRWLCKNDKLYLTHIFVLGKNGFIPDTVALEELGENGMFADWINGSLSLLLSETKESAIIYKKILRLVFEHGVFMGKEEITDIVESKLKNYIEE